MQKSESIAKLSKALATVQANLKPAVKDATNPHFKSKYADLSSIWDSCREPLSKNGLSVVQGNSVGLDGTIIVETILLHESGEWIQSELALPLSKQDPQGVGSAMTYGRRYGLAAIVGIVADVDDDGIAASSNRQPAQFTPKAVEAPTDREIVMREITALCKELNAAGAKPQWSGKVLNEYVVATFGDEYSIETINEKQARTIAKGLTDKRDAMKEAA